MELKYQEKILIVDDDANLLAGLKRQLRGTFNIAVGEGAREGLRLLTEEGPIAVVVSDMRMPEMNGIQFLAKAREISTETVRIMLTGNADLDTAMNAVNEGSIYRFLVKPSPKSTLVQALEAGIGQYRLVVAERQLLEDTLNGSVQVLADILALVSPFAFGRASRARRYVKQMAEKLGLDRIWQYELSALLSQIGYITLPAETRAKLDVGNELDAEERQAALEHGEVGRKLLARIPRLEIVADMIAGQNRVFLDYGVSDTRIPEKQEILGGMMLKTALDFDSFVSQGYSAPQAIGEMRRNEEDYHPLILKSLKNIGTVSVELQVKQVDVKVLNDSMILAEEVKTHKGMLVAPKGQPVSQSMRALLMNYVDRGEIRRAVHVLVPTIKEEMSQPAVVKVDV